MDWTQNLRLSQPSSYSDCLLSLCLADSSLGLGMVSMTDDMVKSLESERKARKADSIPETVRAVLGEYFKKKSEN